MNVDRTRNTVVYLHDDDNNMPTVVCTLHAFTPDIYVEWTRSYYYIRVCTNETNQYDNILLILLYCSDIGLNKSVYAFRRGIFAETQRRTKLQLEFRFHASLDHLIILVVYMYTFVDNHSSVICRNESNFIGKRK